MKIPAEDAECGIEGRDDEPLTVGKFNHWFMLYMRLHIKPLEVRTIEIKNKQSVIEKEVRDYIEKDVTSHARLEGGMKTIMWMIPLISAILGALLALGVYIYNRELSTIARDVSQINDQLKDGTLALARERIEQHRQRLEKLEKGK